MEFISNSAQQTEEIAHKVGKAVLKGCFFALYGGLGAGKTAFVRGFAKGLGFQGHVSSPTFSLMNDYSGGRLPLYHFDLYRIDAAEVEKLGFEEIFEDASSVSVVEWCERLERHQLPYPRVEVHINIEGETQRSIKIQPLGMELGTIEL